MAKPLALSVLDALLTEGRIAEQTDQVLNDATYSVLFVFDPLHVSGMEIHRCDVDRCGLSDERLREIEAACWAELAARNDRAWGVAA